MNWPYTFAAFLTARSGCPALEAAQSAALAPGLLHNPLFLFGPSGSGKTHLLRSTEDQLSGKALCLTADSLVARLTQAASRHESPTLWDRGREPDALLIDDLQFLQGKEGSQACLLGLLEGFLSQGKQLVLAATVPLGAFPVLEGRLSQFPALSVLPLELPGEEVRLAIGEKAAELLDLSLPKEALCFIARHSTDARQVQGALTRILACRELGLFAQTAENILGMLSDQWLPSLGKHPD